VIARNCSLGALDHQRRDLHSIKLSYLTEDRAASTINFHDALDTLLRQALDRHTWSIEYRCVVFQHSRVVYPDRWEATCLVRRPENSLRGAEVCS
jgi:hypothetical protein